ncbi:prepilin-type N-terminal cleavage/methylation domain-containing protein [Eubacterium ruminantium]|nr:prepilin-type N-terminal cleavage/methylation domain-containing protein [Eubacterium ruminantium]
MKITNKGFSLVELIIVIAIMAILAAAISLTVIRYINKARKADDLAAGDTIGKTLYAAVAADEELYHFIEVATSSTGNNLTKSHKSSGWLRVLGYCNSPRNRYDMKFHAINTAGITAEEKESFEEGMTGYLGTDIPRLQFYLFNYLDEWIICADGDGQIYVFIGSGMNDDRYFMKPQTAGGRPCINNAGRYCYQVWPEVDPAYNKLTTPKDARK